jgi:hypothetical protein
LCVLRGKGRHLTSAVLAIAGWLNATATAAERFAYAAAGRGCTQEDAPALEIYLTSQPFSGADLPAPPLIRIEVAWDDWMRLREREISMSPLSGGSLDPQQPLARAELEQPSTSPVWLGGTIRLMAVEPDRRVAGSYALSTPDGRAWLDGFEARWLDRRPVCG